MITVLHITPHLGGGVGKALSSLISQGHAADTSIKHRILCLETPEKSQFIDQIRDAGCDVLVAPTTDQIDHFVGEADIVQLEWWNHPATIACLCKLRLQPIRLIVWCHVSGLCSPIIPPRLIDASHRFIFTSPCSLEAAEVTGLSAELKSRLAVTSSGGGFGQLPNDPPDQVGPVSIGYLGSLNFAKLHPNFVSYLAAVKLPHFTVRLIGDLLNRDTLEAQCQMINRAGLLDFRGYTNDIATELASVNVLAYLLNPKHYGTAENALLESMAMGIVPVVLDNAAERCIVTNMETGLVVQSPAEFADAINWLNTHPIERAALGANAALSVRTKFTPARMESSFRSHYEIIRQQDKRATEFSTVFGTTPDEWFLSCQRDPAEFDMPDSSIFRKGDPDYFTVRERTKGSAIHFSQYFPGNQRLTNWASALERSS